MKTKNYIFVLFIAFMCTMCNSPKKEDKSVMEKSTTTEKVTKIYVKIFD